MTSTLLAADSAYIINRRGIYYALILSLGVHIYAYFTLSPILRSWMTHDVLSTNTALRILLSPIPEPLPLPTRAKRPLLEEIVVPGNRRSRGVAPPKDRSLPTPADRPRLEVSEVDIRAVLAGSNIISDDTEAFTENGAAVLDQHLLLTLNKAKRTRVSTDFQLARGTRSDGVSFTEFIQIGRKCFRVDLGNPLDSFSREMWYRVKCPP